MACTVGKVREEVSHRVSDFRFLLRYRSLMHVLYQP